LPRRKTSTTPVYVQVRREEWCFASMSIRDWILPMSIAFRDQSTLDVFCLEIIFSFCLFSITISCHCEDGRNMVTFLYLSTTIKLIFRWASLRKKTLFFFQIFFLLVILIFSILLPSLHLFLLKKFSISLAFSCELKLTYKETYLLKV
jgi:hypothetical protein